jgi:hypothetical protein
VTLEILTEALKKILVFWDITLCLFKEALALWRSFSIFIADLEDIQHIIPKYQYPCAKLCSVTSQKPLIFVLAVMGT